MSKLMKPLFINGMYNREGKCIRANYLKTIGEYPLWIADGKPDKDYAKIETDKYYLYIQVDEWIIMFGYTEYELEQRTGQDYLNKEWYGDFKGREKYFNEHFYKGREYKEYEPLVKEHVKKEEEFIEQFGKTETLQAQFLKTLIDKTIANYIEARDNNGNFADFIGAAFLKELNKCDELSKVIKKDREEKELIRKIEISKQKEKEAEEKNEAEKLLLKETEDIFVNGGTIKNGDLIIKLANKYNVDIPIRTKGWISDCLAESIISSSGSVTYKYWKKKGATGSQKIYSVLLDIRSAIMA